jgi:hypothetical protein
MEISHKNFHLCPDHNPILLSQNPKAKKCFSGLFQGAAFEIGKETNSG